MLRPSKTEVQIPAGRHLLRWVCYRHSEFDSEPPDLTNSACLALTSSKPARLCVSPRQRTHRIGASSLSLPDCQRAYLPASGSDRLRRLSPVNIHLFSIWPCVRRHQVIYAPLFCRQGGNRKFFSSALPCIDLTCFRQRRLSGITFFSQMSRLPARLACKL